MKFVVGGFFALSCLAFLINSFYENCIGKYKEVTAKKKNYSNLEMKSAGGGGDKKST